MPTQRPLKRELKVVCFDEDAGIAGGLADKYRDTKVYIGDFKNVTITSTSEGQVSLSGVRRPAEPLGVSHKLNPDVVLLVLRANSRYSGSQSAAEYLRKYQQLLEMEPDLPILAVMPSTFVKEDQKSERPRRLRQILERPMSDCIFSSEDMEELHFRIRRLFAVWTECRQQTKPTRRPRAVLSNTSHEAGIVNSFVPELRNEKTGRLDAKKVSQMFGLTVTDAANILGRDKSSVSKTPDSENIQPSLRVFERIAAMLPALVKQPEQLRMWMNAPNKEFNGKTPMEHVKEGLGEIVAQRLENALSGLPA